jgi:hypothetical protein
MFECPQKSDKLRVCVQRRVRLGSGVEEDVRTHGLILDYPRI